MSAEFEKLREIFLSALEQAPDRRDAYLNQLCGGDEELRRNVAVMLKAHAAGDGPLDRGAIRDERTTDHETASEVAGSVIGPYKLLEPIGEGGMGLVFVAAQQHPVRRKVALKVIKPGMDTRQVVARFEAERQALALMEHPNIAKVFDGGATASGRPYFVMELVKGVPITEYCDREQIPIRGRLGLFVDVCRAVQHAHQKGVIHRDIKPANVLVTVHDTTPVVKVIDFGVAKALGHELTDKTLFTGFAQMIGTPLYMSPEQAGHSGLDVDTRSDVYSLGVLLYELLTGTTPFDRERFRTAGLDEIRRIIREEEPARPSTRLSTLGQAAATVSANRDSDPKRLSRLCRGELDWIVMKALEKDRNRRYESASSFAADLGRYLRDEPVQACPPSARYRFRKFARRNKRALATTAIVGLALLVAIGGLAGSIGWAVRDRAAQRETRELEANSALRQAAQQLEQGHPAEALAWSRRAEVMLARGTAPAELQQRLDQVRADLDMVARLEEIRIGQSEVEHERFAIGETDPKYALAFRAYGIDVEALEPDPAAERIRGRSIRLELTGALDDWADVRRQLRPDDPSWRQLLAVATAADGDEQRCQLREVWRHNDQQTLMQLAASDRLATQPAATLVLLSRTLLLSGRVENSVALLRRAQQRYPNDFWINHNLAHGLTQLQPPRWQEALPYYVAALALRPDSPGVRLNLSTALLKKGDPDWAVAILDEAIRLKPDYASAWYARGRAQAQAGHPDKALADYTRCLDLKPDHWDVWTDRGKAYFQLRQWDKALANYTKAIELRPGLAHAWAGRGSTYRCLGQWDKAIADITKAIDLEPEYAEAWTNRGAVYADMGQLDQALAHYTKAIELNPTLEVAWHNRGMTHNTLRQWDKALTDCSKAIELKPNYASAWNDRGWAHHNLRQWPKALADYTRAIELKPDLMPAWQNRGITYFSLSQWDRALTDFTRAIELQPLAADVWRNRGDTYRCLSQWDLAVADYTKAIELQPNLVLAWQFRAATRCFQGEWDKAVADYTKAIELQKDNSDAQFGLAWLLATHPEPNRRDPGRAVELATRAVTLKPKQGNYWLVLGMAQYRAGNWTEARTALEKSMALRNGGDANDMFFLAMAQWRLGNTDQARQTYDRAIQWLEKNKVALEKDQPHAEEFRRFRSEAEEVLQMKKK